MSFLKNFIVPSLLGLLAVSAAAQNGALGSVSRVSIVNENPLQIQIQTSKTRSPHVQMVSNPERLVIDIPNSVPGAGLHGLAVNRGGAHTIRVGAFSAKPPITRVVVDLNTPESYRVVPNASGVLVSLGTESEDAGTPEPAIGWVSANVRNVHSAPLVQKPSARQASRVNGVSVLFSNGQLTIHAENATLSEVLFQIQKRTGAEIAIPSGTEQERVAADFGPGTASEVMGELLNGTGLNFVVVGSPSDPTQLRSVLLSRKAGDADPPSAFQTVVNNTPPSTAPVVDPPNFGDSAPPPENAPQVPSPEGAPPPQTDGPEQQVPD